MLIVTMSMGGENGIARQSEDALSRATRINHLRTSWKKKVPSPLAQQLIDALASNPIITIRQSAQSMGVSYTTMQRAIKSLEALSIVRETSGGKRNRIYCAQEILRILEEPAKISP